MIIEKEFEIKKASYFKGLSPRAICFDIETTGLSRKFSHTTVIGTGYVKADKIIFRQWLLDNPSLENEMLKEFCEYLKGFDLIIQFNGNSFDLPYIKERCEIFGMPDPFEGMAQLDLYKIAKKHKRLFNPENLKQKSLEKLFGIKRRDKISGRDCIYAYNDYLRYNDLSARDALLLHNEDDVLGLLKIYPISAFDKLLKAAKISAISGKDTIIFEFELDYALPFEVYRQEAFYEIEAKENFGRLKLKPVLCTRKLFFENYKDYFYLPDEDRAIHKSVGIYVDPAMRQRAVKSNCYEKTHDCFYLQHTSAIRPAFKEESKSKELWFRRSDMKRAQREAVYELFMGYLEWIFG